MKQHKRKAANVAVAWQLPFLLLCSGIQAPQFTIFVVLAMCVLDLGIKPGCKQLQASGTLHGTFRSSSCCQQEVCLSVLPFFELTSLCKNLDASC